MLFFYDESSSGLLYISYHKYQYGRFAPWLGPPAISRVRMGSISRTTWETQSIYVNNPTQSLDCSYSELDNGSIPRIKTKGIQFAHLNIHSLVSKIDELQIWLKHRPFDVICLNETLCDTSRPYLKWWNMYWWFVYSKKRQNQTWWCSLYNVYKHPWKFRIFSVII